MLIQYIYYVSERLAGGGDVGPLAIGLTMTMPLEGCFLEVLVDAPPLSVWILWEKSLSMLDRQRSIPTSCSFLKALSLQIHTRFRLWWLHFNIKVSSKRGWEGLLLHKINLEA
jgi:hypothetical protein